MSDLKIPGDLAPGTELPSLQWEPGFHHWNRYAAVNDEFVPIHMDDEAGRAAGYVSAFGMGNLQWSYLHNLLEAWLDGRGRVVRLACQFRSPTVKGLTVTAHGTVTGARERGGETWADLEVWTEDQDGNRIAPGTATVAFGSVAGVQADLDD
jgi:acyl dehydratase